MYIYKDYQIINGTLYKVDLDDSRHLMWQFGGVPCIDADNVWERHKHEIDEIVIRTKKGRFFKINAFDFEQHKEVIDFGFGRQYYVKKDKWEFRDVQKDIKQEPIEVEKEEPKQEELNI